MRNFIKTYSIFIISATYKENARSKDNKKTDDKDRDIFYFLHYSSLQQTLYENFFSYVQVTKIKKHATSIIPTTRLAEETETPFGLFYVVPIFDCHNILLFIFEKMKSRQASYLFTPHNLSTFSCGFFYLIKQKV